MIPVEPYAPRDAIVLVNLGTPRAPTRAAVAAFLAEFLADQRVVELPALLWRPLLRAVVIPLRAARVAHAYASIWEEGGSPLRAIGERQRAGLERRLQLALGARAPSVHLAMTYQGPSVAGVLAALQASGVQRVCVLPLYPQYSATTTAAVFDRVAAYLRSVRCVPHLVLVRDYHEHPALIAALAASVRDHWSAHGRAGHLLMSFHGIPEANVRKGDPYAAHCERTAQLLAAALGLQDGEWTLAYQSRFGRAKWLEPYTDATLLRLAREGIPAVDVICPAFAADCLETLEEIAVENRKLFLDAGGTDYRSIRCLNDREDHLAALAEVALAALGQGSPPSPVSATLADGAGPR